MKDPGRTRLSRQQAAVKRPPEPAPRSAAKSGKGPLRRNEPAPPKKAAKKKPGPKLVNWRPAFLEALRSAGGSVQAAADAAGVARSTVYAAREAEKDLAAAWDEAKDAAIDDAEDLLFSLAMGRVKRPVFYQGKRIGEEPVFSEGALFKYLEGKRRATWGRKAEITGAGGGPLKLQGLTVYDLEAMSDEELEAMKRRLAESAA